MSLSCFLGEALTAIIGFSTFSWFFFGVFLGLGTLTEAGAFLTGDWWTDSEGMLFSCLNRLLRLLTALVTLSLRGDSGVWGVPVLLEADRVSLVADCFSSTTTEQFSAWEMNPLWNWVNEKREVKKWRTFTRRFRGTGEIFVKVHLTPNAKFTTGEIDLCLSCRWHDDRLVYKI